MQEEPIGATPRDVHHGVYREEVEVDLTFEVQRILTMLPVTRANAAPGRFEALQVVEQYADNLGEVAEVLLRLRLLRLRLLRLLRVRLLRLRLWLRALILLAFHLPQQTVKHFLGGLGETCLLVHLAFPTRIGLPLPASCLLLLALLAVKLVLLPSALGPLILFLDLVAVEPCQVCRARAPNPQHVARIEGMGEPVDVPMPGPAQWALEAAGQVVGPVE
jgi:hypothetical protein